MKRRNFIQSILYAVTALLSMMFQTRALGGAGSPKVVAESPVARKRLEIGEAHCDGQVTLFRDHDTEIVLNETGGAIWKEIDGRQSCDHISDRIAKLFEIERDRASRDVTAFVHRLEKEGFVTIPSKVPCYALRSA